MIVVEFVKKDGTLRKMYAKVGVSRFRKKVSRKYKLSDPKTITVWDCESKGYRNINVTSVVSFNCGNKNWSDV